MGEMYYIVQTFNQLVREQKAIGRDRRLRMGIGVGNYFGNHLLYSLYNIISCYVKEIRLEFFVFHRPLASLCGAPAAPAQPRPQPGTLHRVGAFCSLEPPDATVHTLVWVCLHVPWV